MTGITSLAPISRNLVNNAQLIISVPILHAYQIQRLFCIRLSNAWFNYILPTHNISSLVKTSNVNSKMGHIFHLK